MTDSHASRLAEQLRQIADDDELPNDLRERAEDRAEEVDED